MDVAPLKNSDDDVDMKYDAGTGGVDSHNKNPVNSPEVETEIDENVATLANSDPRIDENDVYTFQTNVVNNETKEESNENDVDMLGDVDTGGVDSQNNNPVNIPETEEEVETEIDVNVATLANSETRSNVDEIETKSPSVDNNNDKTNEESNDNYDETWTKPVRNPTKVEEKKMFAEVLGIIVKVLMNNHIYTFGGDMRVQKGDGSIGDRATGVIAEIVMIWWDKKFKGKLNELEVSYDVIKRYLDDINGVFKTLAPGTEFKNNELRINEDKIEEEKAIHDDTRTMTVKKDIANSIDSMIQMTIDTPSSHTNNKVPMLDLEVWLEKEDKNKIYYNFFQKPEKNRLVLMKSSAMPMNQKMNVLTQETFRRLYNTKEEVDSDTKVSILNKFMEDLKVSGYNERERFYILRGGFKTFENVKEKSAAGERPFYRPANFNKDERKSIKKKKKYTWHNQKNDKFSSVMFVEPTPNGELVKKLRETEAVHKIDETQG